MRRDRHGIMRPGPIDWLIYRLFYWAWSPILKERPDMCDYIAHRLRGGSRG